MTDRTRQVLILIAVAIGAFLIGAGWQYLSARSLSRALADAERAAAFNALEGTLGAATIEAQRGSFEIARQHASDFFTGLQADVGRATDDVRATLQEMLGQRDAMITALSRADPQSAAMLERLFTRYRLALDHPVGPADAEPTPPPAAVDSPADSIPPATTTGS
jgi:hypothetical protein